MSSKVIAGFDGSDESRDALRLAKELADADGAELHVAVVLPRGGNPFERAVAGTPLAEQLDAQRFGAAEAELADTPFTKASLDGGLAGRSAARALHDYAEEQAASLIVVGSSHRGAVGRVLAGSVGESLLRGAPCAVAVASRGYAAEASRRGVIGVAFDGRDEAKLALAEGERIARLRESALRVIAVVPEIAPLSVQGFDVSAIQESMRDEYEDALEQAVAGISDAIEVEQALELGEPASVLADQTGELDLLVAGSRGYGRMRAAIAGGVSSKLVRSAGCPVLVTPRAGRATTTS